MVNQGELTLREDLPEDHRSGFVAVLGKPNVGKSTLINAYVGQKVAIVSSKPQTTRRTLRGILTLPQAQVVFVDTPGLHKPRHKLGEFMVESAARVIPDADVVLFMVDVSVSPSADDEELATLIRQRGTAPCIMVMNKVDLLPQGEEARARAYESICDCGRSVVISATEGRNRDQLLQWIIGLLPPGPRFYPPDEITDQPLRFMAAELVREQVLNYLYQEVPHWVAVVVEEFEERREDLTYIEATVYVSKESQKGIVIGERGEMLKRIGAAARGEIERLLGTRVYLDLWVKVRDRWPLREAALRDLGFVLPRGSEER
ncbi:MAG: GTPase Era [Anaerolineae bacterium]|nr:GTPase Era [Anaerolineae bacterium]